MEIFRSFGPGIEGLFESRSKIWSDQQFRSFHPSKQPEKLLTWNTCSWDCYVSVCVVSGREFGSDQCPDLTRGSVPPGHPLCGLSASFTGAAQPSLTYELYEKFTVSVSDSTYGYWGGQMDGPKKVSALKITIIILTSWLPLSW